MIDLGHPNFPPSLSITPNACSAHKDTWEDDAFGVEAQRDAISQYGIAGRVWEAAYVLCAYVDPDPALRFEFEFDPPFAEDGCEPVGAIELGSGTGVVAASIARAVRSAVTPGGFVIATDLPDVCSLLERNLGIDTSGGRNTTDSAAVFVRPLAWGVPGHATAVAHEFGFTQLSGSRRLTHIVCSDLVYFPELLAPLLRTLIHLTSPACIPPSRSPTKVIISYKVRSLAKETPFWMAFGLWFSFGPVLVRCRAQCAENEDVPVDDKSDIAGPWRQFGTGNDADRTFVFVARRRPESIAWDVPETDKELMEGVGARGALSKKGDDTFETILFMAIGIE